jgi:hypothetical protein
MTRWNAIAMGAAVMLAAAASATWAQNSGAAPAKAGQSSQGAFEEGKALGRSKASTTDGDLRNGRSEEAVRSTVQGYTANPPAASTYGNQTGARSGTQMRSDCAAGQGSTDPATCEAIGVGSQQRDLGSAKPEVSTLDSQAAISRPESVLGNITKTYNACSVGGQLTGAPTWANSTCQVSVTSWTDTTCTKTLSLRPVQTQTCEDKSIITGGQGTSPGDTGPWSVSVSGYCSLPTGGKPMRFVSTGDINCGDPVKHDLDLYTLPALNEEPAPVGTVPVRLGDGSCKQMPAYAYGPGCSGNTCRVELHFSPDGFERVNSCPGGAVIARDINFDTWSYSKEQANRVCLGGFPNRFVAEQLFGKGIPGDYGVQRATGSRLFWVVLGGAVFDHVEWPKDHVGMQMSFTLPRVYPPNGDVWSSGCAGLEARTKALPPDGVGAAKLPLLPMLAESSANQCVLKSSTCTDGPSTRVIDGQRVARACWSYRNVFSCTRPAPASSCAPAKDKSCSVSGTPKCERDDGRGHCLRATFDYACRTSAGTFSQAVNCGDSSYCANGSCWESDDTRNKDNQNYAMAMAQFQARAEAAKDITLEPLHVHIFKGRDLRCRRANFGIDNCCADSGVTQQCNDTEKELFRLKKDGRCVQVGEYCSKGSIFGCRERTRTHCCFNSVLGRLIQEQGRAQLGMNWGDGSKKPNCDGLTPDQLARVDWSRLDLSDYYATLKLEPKAADQTTVVRDAENSQQACYYGAGKC